MKTAIPSIAALNLMCVIQAAAQLQSPPQIVYEGDIVFPSEILISTIDQIVQVPNGNLYIVDRLGQAVHYVSLSGNLIHTLSLKNCDPGRNFTPYWLSSDGEMTFVLNGGPAGYLFDSSGKCLGRVSDQYYPLRLQISSGSGIMGLTNTTDPTKPLGIIKATIKGETTDITHLPFGEYPAANRRIATGGLVATKWATYFSPPADPVIYRIDLEGRVSEIKVDNLFNYKRPTGDMHAGGPGPELFASFKHFRNATTNMGIFDSGVGLLVAQYFTRPGRWDRLWFDGEMGAVSWAESDTLGFTYMSDGMAFRVRQPDVREDGTIPNPYLEKYIIRP